MVYLFASKCTTDLPVHLWLGFIELHPNISGSHRPVPSLGGLSSVYSGVEIPIVMADPQANFGWIISWKFHQWMMTGPPGGSPMTQETSMSIPMMFGFAWNDQGP